MSMKRRTRRFSWAVAEDWNSTLQVEETTADNEKVISVPADTDWKVLWIWVEYTSNATVGNRKLLIELRDSGDDVIMQLRNEVLQPASKTYYYAYGVDLPNDTEVMDTDYVQHALPSNIVLPELFDIHFVDEAGITSDSAGEDLIIQMMVNDRMRIDT